MRAGEYGILGVGMNTTPSGVPSPVLGMRGALGRRWSIHVGPRRGRLVLGARPPTGPAVTTINLAPQAAATGGPFWRDQRVPLCVGVGALRSCVPGIFDSGTFQLQVSGSPLNTAPTVPGTSRVVAGLPVTVALPGAAAPTLALHDRADEVRRHRPRAHPGSPVREHRRPGLRRLHDRLRPAGRDDPPPAPLSGRRRRARPAPRARRCGPSRKRGTHACGPELRVAGPRRAHDRVDGVRAGDEPRDGDRDPARRADAERARGERHEVVEGDRLVVGAVVGLARRRAVGARARARRRRRRPGRRPRGSSPRPITAKRPGCRRRATSSSAYQPPGP